MDPLCFLDEDKREKLIESISVLNNNKRETENDDSANESEKTFIKTGCTSEAKGSCYIEIGNTKVICALYGPREIPKRDEFNYKIANLHCEFRYATFSSYFNDKFNNAGGGNGNLISIQTNNSSSLFQQQQQTQQKRQQHSINQNLSSIIEEALKPSILLHKYPKSQIDIYILCIENDFKKQFSNNTVLSASIIAASMSLADAHIECYDLVSSYTNNLNNLTLSYMPSLHQITSIYFVGESKTGNNAISIDLYKSYVKNAVESCKKVAALMKYVLVNKYNENNSFEEDDHSKKNIEDDNNEMQHDF